MMTCGAGSGFTPSSLASIGPTKKRAPPAFRCYALGAIPDTSGGAGSIGGVMAKSRMILIDDHRLFRDGLRAILSAYPDLSVVGEAGDYREALEVCEHIECDLVILDISLPGSNGLALLRELKRRRQRQPVLI